MIEQILLFSRLNKDTYSVLSESTDQNVNDEVEKSLQLNEEFYFSESEDSENEIGTIPSEEKTENENNVTSFHEDDTEKPHKKYVNIF